MHKTPLLIAAALLTLSGCGTRFSRLQDTRTIHDATANRIWIIQDTVDEQHVVLCDTAMLATMRTLCIRASITQAPGGPPMMPRAQTPPAGTAPATPAPAPVRSASAK